MVNVTRTFTVSRPPSTVVAYLADFGNAVQWDPGTVSCTRLDDGPVQVGATWHNVSKVLGRHTDLTYRLVRLEPDHVTFVGENRTAISTDDITIEPADADGAKITYRATIQFKGFARLAGPLMTVVFERLGDPTVAGITAAIERL